MALPNRKVEENIIAFPRDPRGQVKAVKKKVSVSKRIDVSTMALSLISHLPKLELRYSEEHKIGARSILQALASVVVTNIVLLLYLFLVPTMKMVGGALEINALERLGGTSEMSYSKVLLAFGGVSLVGYMAIDHAIAYSTYAGSANPLIVLGAGVVAIYGFHQEGLFKK